MFGLTSMTTPLNMLVAAALCVVLVLGVVQARLMYIELNASAPSFHSRQFDNQSIVFVGDSLLRYQYLSLAYMVHHSTYYPDESMPNILMHVTFKDWIDFYEGTNSVFGSHEHCDCFRSNNDAESIYENRYYFNKQRNISISYIQYFGDSHESHGHWSPTDKESNHDPQYGRPDHEFHPYRWQYSISDTLANIAARLNPKPSVLLLNAGHWPNKWGEETHRNTVLALALSLFDRVIWKTTNPRNDSMPGEYAHDEACAYPGVECMNIDWTKYLSSADYTDFVHFQPRIYTDLNIQLIHQLMRREPLLVAPMNEGMRGSIVVYKGKEYVVDKRGILRPFDVPLGAGKKAFCDYDARTRVHVHVNILLKHLLGDHVADICAFDG